MCQLKTCRLCATEGTGKHHNVSQERPRFGATKATGKHCAVLVKNTQVLCLKRRWETPPFFRKTHSLVAINTVGKHHSVQQKSPNLVPERQLVNTVICSLETPRFNALQLQLLVKNQNKKTPSFHATIANGKHCSVSEKTHRFGATNAAGKRHNVLLKTPRFGSTNDAGKCCNTPLKTPLLGPHMNREKPQCPTSLDLVPQRPLVNTVMRL